MITILVSELIKHRSSFKLPPRVYLVLGVDDGGDEPLLELFLVLGRNGDGGHKAAVRDHRLFHTVAVHCTQTRPVEKT